MRKVINIDKDWKFSKEASSVPSTFPSDWESIDLPYTFNGDDGQDGGNDYYRGKGYFAKSLAKSDMPDGEEVYLQLDGVNSKVLFILTEKKFAFTTADILPLGLSLMILRTKICLLLLPITRLTITFIPRLRILHFTAVFTGM